MVFSGAMKFLAGASFASGFLLPATWIGGFRPPGNGRAQAFIRADCAA